MSSSNSRIIIIYKIIIKKKKNDYHVYWKTSINIYNNMEVVELFFYFYISATSYILVETD